MTGPVCQVLLVNPPQELASPGAKAYVPPLGLLYLREMLEQDGVAAAVVDMDSDGRSAEDLCALIERSAAHTVGISVYTRTRASSYRLARTVKERFPDVFLILGGAHCTLVPTDALASGCADLVVSGECEWDIARLVRERPRGVVRTESPTDLDALPFPTRAPPFIDRSIYGHLLRVRFAQKCGVVSSSRGCPRACSFCLRVGLVRYRARSPESFVRELEQLAEQGYQGVILNDDNFLASPRRALRIAELILRRGIKLDLAMQGSAVPSDELWHALSEAGFVVACVGVEHIKPSIVAYFRKSRDPRAWPDRVARTAALMNRYDFISCGSFILGAPDERREDAERLIRFLGQCGFDLKNSNELLYSYGTPLWRDAVAAGLITPDRFHVRVSEVFPEKRAYLDEMTSLAWSASLRSVPSVVRKLLQSRKRDKLTPLVSVVRALASSAAHFFRDRPDQGYGQLEEV